MLLLLLHAPAFSLEPRIKLIIGVDRVPECQPMSTTRQKLSRALLSVLLIGAALDCAALTLGRASGAVWIGQRLDLVVPVQGEANVSSESLCPVADVFYGDSKQDGSRIHVLVEPTTKADAFNLRISSSATVDEPFVSIYLRIGCAQTIARRFVLLADYPTEIVAAETRPAPEPLTATTTLAPAAALAPPVAKATQATERKALASLPGPQSKAKRAVKPIKKLAPMVSAKPRVVSRSKPAPVAAVPLVASPKRARLKLEPLEYLTEPSKTLAPAASVKVSEEVGRDSQRIQQMQEDINALLAQAKKNETNLLAMRERLEKAESGQAPMMLVYALTVLVLLSLSGVAVLWLRRGERSVWQDGLPMAYGLAEPRDASKDAQPQGDANAHALIPTPEPNAEVAINGLDLNEKSSDLLTDRLPVQTSAAVVAPSVPNHPVRLDSEVNHTDVNPDSMVDLLHGLVYGETPRATGPKTSQVQQIDLELQPTAAGGVVATDVDQTLKPRNLP